MDSKQIRKPHIAILDDGVNGEFYSLENIKNDLYVSEDQKIIKRKKQFQNTHGSICAAIINKYCDNIQISSLQVIDNFGTGNIIRLIKALEWCLENEPDIIHLSLGTIHYEDFEQVSKACIRLLEKDIIIIAALDNKEKYGLPAAMPGVVRVKQSDSLYGDQTRIEDTYYGQPLLQASGEHKLLSGFGKMELTNKSNSYAAPIVTARIARAMKRISKKKILEKLYAADYSVNAQKNIYLPYCFREASFEVLEINICSLFFEQNNCAKTVICDKEGLGKIIKTDRLSCYENLIYTGILDPNMRKKIKTNVKKLICDEAQIVTGIEKNAENKNCAPIIVICGEPRKIINLTKQLQMEFLRDEYHAILLSDIEKSYLCGFHWSNNKNNIPFHLQYLEKNLGGDVLIYATENIYNEQRSIFDYVISIEESDEESDYHIDNLEMSDVEYIYKNVMKILA
ncbi:MAG: S8 family serine peptidase [Christensenellaceae bacterium]|jgi:hypothetical protein